MTSLLSIEEVIGAITTKRPTDFNEAIAWDKRDKQAKHYILSTLEDKFLLEVGHLEKSKEIWDYLCNVHANQTSANKMGLQQQFFASTKAANESVTSYLGEMTTLAAE